MAEEIEIESKDLLEFMGVEGKDLNEIKTNFNAKYVPADTHKAKLGEINGITAKGFKKQYADLGIEVEIADLKDKSLLDINSEYLAAAKTKLEDLEKQNKLTKEQLESELSGDLEKYKTQVKDWETKFNTIKTDYDTFKTETETANKNREINTRLSEAKGSLTFSDNVSELERKGFHSTINEKYKFEVVDGVETVRNDKNELVMSTANAGSNASFKEVYETEFKAADLGKKADSKKVRNFGTNQSSTTTTTSNEGRPIAERH